MKKERVRDPDREPVVECEGPAGCDMPREFIDLTVREWERFKVDPGDFQAFLDFDLTFMAALEKWHQYSWRRKVAAR